MSIKSNTIKRYIKDTGSKNQLFVFVGSDTSTASSNSTKSFDDIWKQSDFSIRVGQNSILPVVPNNKWVAKRPYSPWSSVSENTANYYIYNDLNQYVYLCISDNANNRKDLIGQNVSNNRPSHILGIQSYDDGFSWKPLYKITSSMERFVTAMWIPVISFDMFDSDSQKTQAQQTTDFCVDATGTGEIGQCAVYAKIGLSTDDDGGTTEYEQGTLFTTSDNLTCSDCHYLMKDNDRFVTRFYSDGDDVPTTIVIQDEYTKVGGLISQNQVSTASPYYYLYATNTNDDVEEGSVISAFIDLSNFDPNELVAGSVNPELTIVSNTGSGASIRLITGILNDSNVITGIEVVSSGSGYRDIQITLDSSQVISSGVATSLAAAIEVNLDIVDGLAFDPVTLLNAQHIMIDAKLDKTSIEDAGILLPDNINMFGLIENPLGIDTSTAVGSGSNLNKKLDYIFRTTVKAKVYNPGSQSVLPVVGEIYDILDASEITGYNLGIGSALNASTGGSALSEVELKNLVYSSANNLVGVGLDGPTNGSPKGNNTIIEILEIPNFTQYSGKVVSTTKLSSDLPVADVDSVIIRINIVKGM